MLEWERRAKHPSKATDRISPYLRYFTAGSPSGYYGSTPVILVAFNDVSAETQFLLQTRAQLAENRVHVPFLATHAAAPSETGILGRSWRSSSDLRLRRMTLGNGNREDRRNGLLGRPKEARGYGWSLIR